MLQLMPPRSLCIVLQLHQSDLQTYCVQSPGSSHRISEIQNVTLRLTALCLLAHICAAFFRFAFMKLMHVEEASAR